MNVAADGLTEEEVIAALASALAEELNIHPLNVDVSYNPETGEATYIINGESAEEISDAIAIIQADEFKDSLIVDDISIDSIIVSDDIVVSIDVIVDASNTDNPDLAMASAIEAIETQDSNYGIIGEGNLS